MIDYFAIAREVANGGDPRRHYRLGAVGIRSDQAIVYACNGPSTQPEARAHAEFRLSRKLDKNSVVYVARVRRDDGKFALSRPCPSCLRMLGYKGVTRCYYTIEENEYGYVDY